MIWVVGVILFVTSALIDALHVLWVHFAERNQWHKAAITSMVNGSIGGLSILLFVNVSWWLVIPDILGLGLGSYIGIYIKRRYFNVDI